MVASCHMGKSFCGSRTRGDWVGCKACASVYDTKVEIGQVCSCSITGVKGTDGDYRVKQIDQVLVRGSIILDS